MELSEVDLNVFDNLEERIDALLGRLTELKQENEKLKASLSEKDRLLGDLNDQKEAAQAANGEAKKRLEALLARLEAEV